MAKRFGQLVSPRLLDSEDPDVVAGVWGLGIIAQCVGVQCTTHAWEKIQEAGGVAVLCSYAYQCTVDCTLQLYLLPRAAAVQCHSQLWQ